MAERMFGWYSKRQAELFGCCVYKDILGFEVIVTHVSSSNTQHTTGFDDMVVVGEVFEFVRKIEGRISSKNYQNDVIIPDSVQDLFKKHFKGPK